MKQQANHQDSPAAPQLKSRQGATEALTKAFAVATSPSRATMVTDGVQVKHHDVAAELVDDADHVIQVVGEKKKAFEMTVRFFCYQVMSSSISNIVGTVLGHPLDTIRVRMQIETGQTSFLRTCTETFRGEGVRGFFKGLVSPVVGVTPYNTLVFTVTEAMK